MRERERAGSMRQGKKKERERERAGSMRQGKEKRERERERE